MKVVRLRIHHLMCVHGFEGKGYSPAFVQNFWKVKERLGDDEVIAEAILGTSREDICAPCPNNAGSTCVDEERILKLDNAYAKTLDVKPGDKLSWKDVKKLIAKKVTDDDFEKNCEPCGWKRFGVCKAALKKLRDASGALALVFAALSATAQAKQAQANPTPSAPVASIIQADANPKVVAIDKIEERILQDRKRRIPAFKAVYDALTKSHFDKALKAAKPLESNLEFKDYYHYLSGQAELGRMRKAAKSGKIANAILAGEQATFHFIQVIGTNPYTQLERRATSFLGETEVALAELHLKRKQRKRAIQLFENGFQRLSSVNLKVLVPKDSVVSYALLCEKSQNEMCTSWVVKLAPLVAKSDAARVIERIAAFKRPYIERTHSIPYRVDLDAREFQKGFEQYMKGEFEDAYTTFRDLLKEYPRTNYKLRTKFWMARSAQRSGHGVQAETLYREIIRDTPFAYYAMLAAWYGGIDIARMVDAELPLASIETPVLTPAEVVHIKRAETLIASAVPDLALIELQSVRPTVNMPNEFLVYLAVLNHLAGNHQAAFQVFSELSSRNYSGLYSSYGQKLYFPTARLPLIREVSKDWKLDPLLVLSVVKQESAFNHEAVSYANAFGLMQIIPPTARDLDPKIDTVELFNPNKNVNLGSKYISQLMNRYSGNIVLALAAYNAGPGNADRWKRETPPALAIEEFIEHITYKETREYVQNILRNFYWYNRRLRGENFPNLPALAQSVTPQGLPNPPVPSSGGNPEIKKASAGSKGN